MQENITSKTVTHMYRSVPEAYYSVNMLAIIHILMNTKDTLENSIATQMSIFEYIFILLKKINFV